MILAILLLEAVERWYHYGNDDKLEQELGITWCMEDVTCLHFRDIMIVLSSATSTIRTGVVVDNIASESKRNQTIGYGCGREVKRSRAGVVDGKQKWNPLAINIISRMWYAVRINWRVT